MVLISVVNIKYFIGRSVLLKNSYAIISKYPYSHNVLLPLRLGHRHCYFGFQSQKRKQDPACHMNIVMIIYICSTFPYKEPGLTFVRSKVAKVIY